LSKQRSSFYVKCSSGTYVRSLAEDIADTNGTFATVTALRRIGFEDFNKKLISLDYLLTLVHSDDLINVLKPLNLVFKNANEIILDENAIEHILNGRSVKMNKGKIVDNNEFALAKFKNEIVAIGYLKDNNFYPKRLLNL
jgi:tRNA pseudouridine55 synthase